MVRNKHNTPGIIKYLFWRMTAENPKAVYASVNLGEAYAPGNNMLYSRREQSSRLL